MAAEAMELFHHGLRLGPVCSPTKIECSTNRSSFCSMSRESRRRVSVSTLITGEFGLSRPKPRWPTLLMQQGVGGRGSKENSSKIEELLRLGAGNDDDDDDDEEVDLVDKTKKMQKLLAEYPPVVRDDDEEAESSGSRGEIGDEDSFSMDDDERKDWRRAIRNVISKVPDVEEEMDLVEKRRKMQKLMAEYPLVVEEEDPNWHEDADGWGFSLGQFFNKISIKNVKKDDDEDQDSENEVVWQDDDYIRPIKDIKTAEWEEAIFKDISPLVVLVHNRYKRPKENAKVRDELEKAVQIIWHCRLPSPRCVALDANAELDLVSALRVLAFPELIFTKAGKILYREKAIRTADELAKIMAFFYYGAAKPPCLTGIQNVDEAVPTL